MSNTISVNLENLTDAERQQLMNIVEKSQTKKEWWEDTKFDIREDETYYYVSYKGAVEQTDCFESDKVVIDFGNACKDKAYMERRAKEIKLYNLLSNFAEVVNEGWKPDWKNGNEYKWSIGYGHSNEKFNAHPLFTFEDLNQVYFKTEELAQRAIDEIILPFERGEL